MRSGSRLSGSDASAPATKPLSERKRRRWGSCLVWTDCWRIATEHSIGTRAVGTRACCLPARARRRGGTGPCGNGLPVVSVLDG